MPRALGCGKKDPRGCCGRTVEGPLTRMLGPRENPYGKRHISREDWSKFHPEKKAGKNAPAKSPCEGTEMQKTAVFKELKPASKVLH